MVSLITPKNCILERDISVSWTFLCVACCHECDNNNLFLHWGSPSLYHLLSNFVFEVLLHFQTKHAVKEKPIQGNIFHVCQVPGSCRSIKSRFPTQEEKFPSCNVPCAYLGSVHPLHLPTMEFQALPPYSTSLQLCGQDSQQPSHEVIAHTCSSPLTCTGPSSVQCETG